MEAKEDERDDGTQQQLFFMGHCIRAKLGATFQPQTIIVKKSMILFMFIPRILLSRGIQGLSVIHGDNSGDGYMK